MSARKFRAAAGAASRVFLISRSTAWAADCIIGEKAPGDRRQSCRRFCHLFYRHQFIIEFLLRHVARLLARRQVTADDDAVIWSNSNIIDAARPSAA